MTSNGDEVWRGDIFFVDPFTIEVGERAHDPPADEIMDMAISLHKNGQRRAVECHKSEDRLVLDHGLIRTAAARLICTGFKHTDPETNAVVAVKDKRFKLKVLISNVGIDPPNEQEVADAPAIAPSSTVAVVTMRDFILNDKTVGDILEAWRACPRADWLLWLALKLGVDDRVVVRAACSCARLALSFTQDHRPLRAIQVAERWSDGDQTVTAEVLKELAEECREAGLDAGCYADFAAANAAYAAMYAVNAAGLTKSAKKKAFAAAAAAAVAEAASDAAGSPVQGNAAMDTIRRLCADIVRRRIDEAMILPL